MMMMMQWLFFSLFLSFSSQIPIVQSRCNHHADLSALLHFKDEFEINCTDFYDGHNLGYPKTSTWDNVESLLNGTSVWDGVECDPVTGHVIGLDLSSSCLHGSINSNTSSIFSHLLHLEHLNLAFNDFQSSSIPSELGNLSMLSYLNLSSSSFAGRVPFEISKLSMLTSLDLSSYDFYDLELNFKSLVRNLTNLEKLDLSKIYLYSEIPKWLFTNMSSLRSLKLDYCELKGEFPQGIFHLPKLQYLSIGGNMGLKGHIPSDFNSSTTPLLESLVLGGTNFSGAIPVSIGNLVLLRVLDLSYSQFSGHIHSSFGNLTNLIGLDLSYHTFPNDDFNTLSSVSSSWVGKLTNLRFLGIRGANLTGEIPSFLTKLTQLRGLALSENQLTGEIPHGFVNLTKLTRLELSNNKLQGLLPIRNHINLEWLDVSNNKFHGPLPVWNLRNLRYLDVRDNMLSGTLELDMFLEFRNLTSLLLSSNNFTLLQQQRNYVSPSSELPIFNILALSSCRLSKFPEFLMHQQRLVYLDLSSNNIEGTIPKWMESIKSLNYIDLSHNFITGLDDPRLFLGWSNLQHLDISYNNLKGSVPVPSPSGRTYRASNNELTGEISHLKCNLTSYQVLDFSSNHLTGELDPHCFSKYGLLILNLRNNSFHGKIPEFCTSGSNSPIRMIDLNTNQFQGKIPRSLANCAELEFFDAGSNLINDTSPYWLGSLGHLKVLLLKDNALHGLIGTVPSMTSGYWFPELMIIDLSQNSLSGNLTSCHFEQWITMKTTDFRNPSYMGLQGVFGFTLLVASYAYRVPASSYDYSLTMNNKGVEREYPKILDALVAIDLSSNELEGDIPTTIGDLRGLHLLNISNNHLSGAIPSSLGDLTELESLDLSSNRLSGQLPQQLTGLNFLSAFNVSCNNLTGLIPQGRQFDTFSNSAYLENTGLCGEPLSRKCETSTAQPPNKMEETHDKFWDDLNAKIMWMVVSIGFGGGLIVGIAVENMADWRMLILSWRSKNWRSRG